jgi:hypothetical protein
VDLAFWVQEDVLEGDDTRVVQAYLLAELFPDQELFCVSDPE